MVPMRPSLLDLLHNPFHQFATKVASPAPHCEGPLDLLVYPQPAKIVLLLQFFIPLSLRVDSFVGSETARSF